MQSQWLMVVAMVVMAKAEELLPNSSITFGPGYTLVYNRDTPVYPRSSEQNAQIVSTSKYENHTWYFYHEPKSNKYFVRDETCRFMCLNPCGLAFMSNVLVKHYCKFRIEKYTDMYRLYIPSSNSSTKTTNYRHLVFDSKFNIVRGELNVHPLTSVPYSFIMERTLTNQSGCTKIGKLVAINLDAHESTRCTLPKVREMAPVDVTKEIQVVTNNRYFYHLKLNGGYVTSNAGLNGMMGDYSRFHKEMINTNTYVFRSTDNCNYLCMNKCGVVYMSLKYNTDCKIRVVPTTAANNVYLRFERHHYYLAEDAKGVLSNSTEPTYRSQVQLEMTDLDDVHGYDKKCSIIKTDSAADNDDACMNVANRLGRSMLPTLFVYFVMKNGGGRLVL
ncbi:fgf-2 [Spodoptera frugiperda granulovirus]|uniref:Fgf-2 n=1 Tax=Spodoptera frugiperda granulovirus TaxID=307454 RepID=A0A0C5AQA2_9BBAC|nr:fgf-2 [Spodoptera frugiperda granulovirus]AJK91781.1 fgf-2 [Spodoptera frugiperda granulovirus]AXS01144.1 fgf-2 [Spodoptera frugiperda granulovirus]